MVVVRIVGAKKDLDIPLMAKAYDHRFCQEMDSAEYPSERLQCRAMKTNEANTDRMLELLQGSKIPNFLGEYTCRSQESATMVFDYPDVILLTLVNIQTLADI